ncbi:hypothetical protein D3C72_2521620 [compost metagenome]
MGEKLTRLKAAAGVLDPRLLGHLNRNDAAAYWPQGDSGYLEIGDAYRNTNNGDALGDTRNNV